MTCQQRIETWLEEHGPEFAACADTIHGMAELSGEEHRSATVLEDLLERHGFTVERGLKDQPTAFRAVYGNGPVRIGFMCEYDALASLQQDDVPYQQGNGGPGHGCGHNLLGAGSAAAGIALAQLVDEGLPATVVVYGTPAEETLAGKTIMIENGYFRDVDVCRIWQIKPYNSDDGCQRTSLLHHTCAEPGQPHNGKGEVVVSLLLNAGHISVSADGVNFPDIIVHFSREYLFFAYRLDPAVDFHGQRHSWNQENVRGLFSYGVLKKFFNIHNEPLCLKAAWADYSAVVSAPSGPVHTGSRVSMA